MKTVGKIKSEFFATLWELQNTNPNENLKRHLQTRAETLADILDDDFPAEYAEELDSVLMN